MKIKSNVIAHVIRAVVLLQLAVVVTQYDLLIILFCMIESTTLILGHWIRHYATTEIQVEI